MTHNNAVFNKKVCFTQDRKKIIGASVCASMGLIEKKA